VGARIDSRLSADRRRVGAEEQVGREVDRRLRGLRAWWAGIVAREYGLPAVIGTGSATKRIKTGDRLRVDADAGVVEILA
jgi:PEP-utilising enzyme, mobile domain